jgi:hydrogenase nickel incorporation protein HypA/HybF
MHEFALVQNILGRCLQVANTNKASVITDIVLEVGDFSLVVEHMFQQSFNTLRRDTIARGAVLHINRTPGVIQCNRCGKESDIWWKTAVQDDNAEQKSNILNYEKNVTPNDVLTGKSDFGHNLFQCPHCKSNNTTLIKGKSIVIKNIKIK